MRARRCGAAAAPRARRDSRWHARRVLRERTVVVGVPLLRARRCAHAACAPPARAWRPSGADARRVLAGFVAAPTTARACPQLRCRPPVQAGGMPCVALLRAVTLSSVDAPPHRLTGATLLAACASVGWRDARLYASSGNVVFAGPAGGDEAASCAEAARRLEDALSTALGARVPVTVVAASRLVAALRDAPPPTHAAQQQHFTFLFSPPAASPALDALAVRAAPDVVALLPRRRRGARALRGVLALQSVQRGYRARARRAGDDAQPRHGGRAGRAVRRRRRRRRRRLHHWTREAQARRSLTRRVFLPEVDIQTRLRSFSSPQHGLHHCLARCVISCIMAPPSA